MRQKRLNDNELIVVMIIINHITQTKVDLIIIIFSDRWRVVQISSWFGNQHPVPVGNPNLLNLPKDKNQNGRLSPLINFKVIWSRLFSSIAHRFQNCHIKIASSISSWENRCSRRSNWQMWLQIIKNRKRNQMIRIRKELEDVLIRYRGIIYALHQVAIRAMELRGQWPSTSSSNTQTLKYN